MSHMIKPKSINFSELVKNSNSTLSLDVQSKIVDKLNNTFTENEQHWYIANLYMYMNYHSTNDYPINLEDVFKMIGFANKGNAKRTLENNFTKDEDYKVVILRTEKNLNIKDLGGRPDENIMLNILFAFSVRLILTLLHTISFIFLNPFVSVKCFVSI